MANEEKKTLPFNRLITKDLEKISRAQGMDPDVKDTYDRLRRYRDVNVRLDFLKRREMAWDGIEGNILTESDKEEMKKNGQNDPVQTNKLNKGVQGSAAIVTDQQPEIKFIPIGSDDLYLSELLKRAHDVVWRKSEGTDETYALVEEVKVGGVGFWDSKFDPSKGNFGQVYFEESNPTHYYYDPTSKKRDFSDTDIIKAISRTLRYIKENYPGITKEDLCFDSELGDVGKSHGLTSGDNYAIDFKESSPDNPSNENEVKCVWEIEAWILTTQHRHVTHGMKNGVLDVASHKTSDDAKLAAENNEGLTPLSFVKKVREQRIIVGKNLISKKINPNGVDNDGDPILSMVGVKGQRTKSAYPMSATSYALPSNRDKIKRRMQYVHAAAHLINSPIVRPTAGRWKNGNPGTPGSEFECDNNASFKPYRLGSGAAAVGILDNIESKDDRDIDDQYDLQDVMRGKIAQKIAWQTVYALQEFGGMMTKPFLRSLESGLTRLGKNNIALILRHWSKEDFERLIEPKEWEEWVPDEVRAEIESNPENQQAQQVDDFGNPIKPEELQGPFIKQKWQDALDKIFPKEGATQKKKLEVIDIDVKVMAGSSMPTNRMARLNQAIELKNAEIYDREGALEYIDDPQKDQIVKRTKARDKAAAQAEAVKQLK